MNLKKASPEGWLETDDKPQAELVRPESPEK
jgi:hypothetical protein